MVFAAGLLEISAAYPKDTAAIDFALLPQPLAELLVRNEDIANPERAQSQVLSRQEHILDGSAD